jgi:hypothetical protein
MKLKAFAIVAIIILSLIPLYILYKYIERKIQPRESFRNFGVWLIAVMVLIFAFSFLLVFIIRTLFPGA